MGSKRIGVTTLTFRGHVTSSVTGHVGRDHSIPVGHFLFASSDSFSTRRAV